MAESTPEYLLNNQMSCTCRSSDSTLPSVAQQGVLMEQTRPGYSTSTYHGLESETMHGFSLNLDKTIQRTVGVYIFF